MPATAESIDIERAIARLQNEISDVVLQKLGLQTEVGDINVRLKDVGVGRVGSIGQAVLDKLTKRQIEIRSELAECERQIVSRKQRIRTLSVERDAAKLDLPTNLDDESQIVSDLRLLRSRYEAIAKDTKCLPLARDMAESTIKDLTQIVLDSLKRRAR